MARVEEDVLLGPGYFYVAPQPAGTAIAAPAFTTALELADDPGGTWEDVGYSEDGWALAFSNSFSFWTPAELVDPIVTIKDEAEYHIRGVMAQFSLENLQLALSGGTIVIDTAGVPGTSPQLRHYDPPATSEFNYFSALFITQKGDHNETSDAPCIRHTYVPYIVSVAEVEIPHTKGTNPSLMGVDLRMVKRGVVAPFTIKEQLEV